LFRKEIMDKGFCHHCTMPRAPATEKMCPCCQRVKICAGCWHCHSCVYLTGLNLLPWLEEKWKEWRAEDVATRKKFADMEKEIWDAYSN
jgi:hypothetical protein